MARNEIDLESLTAFRHVRRRGDAALIAQKANCSLMTIYIALSTGRCSKKIEEVIVEFYLQRLKEVDEMIDTIVNTGE